VATFEYCPNCVYNKKKVGYWTKTICERCEGYNCWKSVDIIKFVRACSNCGNSFKNFNCEDCIPQSISLVPSLWTPKRPNCFLCREVAAFSVTKTTTPLACVECHAQIEIIAHSTATETNIELEPKKRKKVRTREDFVLLAAKRKRK
jgi:hypothetical protein